MRLTGGSYVSLFGDSRVTPRPSLVAFVHVHRRMSARTWRPLGRPAWLSRGAVDDLGKISDQATPRGRPIVGLSLPEMDMAGAPGLNSLAAPQAPAIDEVSWTVHFSGAAAAKA